MPYPASNYHRCSNRLHRLSAHSAEEAAAGRQIDGTAGVVPLRLKFCWCIEYHITPYSPDSFFTTNFQFLLFSLFHCFSPYFAKNIVSRILENVPLFSLNLRFFYLLHMYFVSPYFDHDAFMHHTMHVLHAPA